ncbi:hypothetical protein [Hydrogenophaga sp. IBVHS2]|uniref:hypothetical protein n=1 Tax=Hydrogenophaga sp. IBVHS2 TaxID=1985170 RepID=UPI000A2DC90F|nr:hypothetical protein [Hydrogenophaga sp. IBVHS2]OSZ64584.1 hypothetical protein CAP38_09240 [Hydrogenophaga sp. IBVHS2]
MKTKKPLEVGFSREGVAKQAAQKRGEQRTEEVRSKVKATMAVIAQEIATNDGVYPHRNGALSAAEVARRAGVHPTSFYTDKLRDLGEEVRTWLDELKREKVVGSVRVRKTLVARIEDWKKLYEGLLQSHRDTELELQEVQYQLSEARNSIKDLEQQKARLEVLAGEAAGKKVIPLRPKNG